MSPDDPNFDPELDARRWAQWREQAADWDAQKMRNQQALDNAKSLEELQAALLLPGPRVDWSHLPTFGGTPPEDPRKHAVLSWDAQRVLTDDGLDERLRPRFGIHPRGCIHVPALTAELERLGAAGEGMRVTEGWSPRDVCLHDEEGPHGGFDGKLLLRILRAVPSEHGQPSGTDAVWDAVEAFENF